jgi:hypothetical protein
MTNQPSPNTLPANSSRPRLVADALVEIKSLTQEGAGSPPKLAKPVSRSEAGSFKAARWVAEPTSTREAPRAPVSEPVSTPRSKQILNTGPGPSGAISPQAAEALESIRRDLTDIKALLAESIRLQRDRGKAA